MSITTAPFRRVFQAFAAAAVFVGIGSASLHAHDFWMEPRVYRPEIGKLVALRLLVGQDMLGDPIPRDEAAIDRFIVRQGGSESAIPGRDGGDPAGILRVPGDGLMVVGYQSRPRRVDLPRAKFETYLGEEGLDAVAAVFAGAKKQPQVARERFSRCAKALLSSGAPSTSQKDQMLGLKLELVADGNPYASSPRDDMRFTLFYEGAPRPGALVIAINRDDPSAKLSARSDARGRVSFRFPRGGVWMVKAVHMVPLPKGQDADWESFWASLTFELPTLTSAGDTRRSPVLSWSGPSSQRDLEQVKTQPKALWLAMSSREARKINEGRFAGRRRVFSALDRGPEEARRRRVTGL